MIRESKHSALFKSLIKIDTVPPVYIWNIEGVSVELTLKQILSPTRTRRAVFEQKNILIPLIPMHIWERILRDELTQIDVKPPFHRF